MANWQSGVLFALKSDERFYTGFDELGPPGMRPLATARMGRVVCGDATQEDIVLGIILVDLVHASHAPLDTIVQAGLEVMAIEN